MIDTDHAMDRYRYGEGRVMNAGTSSSRSRIRLNLRAIAERRGIDNPTKLASVTGLSRNAATSWWHERVTRVDKSVLEQLCRTLHCRPEDILVWETEENITAPARAVA